MDECDVVYIDDPSDPRLDDFRNLNHSDKRPDMPGGKGLVIAEGLLVVPRLIRSRFPVRAIMGTQAKLHSLLDDANLATTIAKANIPVWCVSREVMAEVVGFDMHRGLLASADRVEVPSISDVLDELDARRDRADQPPVSGTIALLEGVGDHENIGALFRNAAGVGCGCRVLWCRLRGSAIPACYARVDGPCAACSLCLFRGQPFDMAAWIVGTAAARVSMCGVDAV